MERNYDFSGWATRNGLRCSDGRIINKDAFKDNDGTTVPLVWNHQHNDSSNVLGHALLENRDEGVYAYCYLNDTEKGKDAKEQVLHGDISALSIYANQLKQNGSNVMHGAIKEVSLVLAGANPGAYIDNIIRHGEESDEEAIIYSGLEELDIHVEHADEETDSDEETIQDVFNTLTDKQKKVVYYMIAAAISSDKDKEAKHSEESNNDETLEHAEEPASEGEKMEEAKKAPEEGGEKTVQDVFNELTEEQKKVVYFMIGKALEDKGVPAEGEENMKHNAFDDENKNENVLSHSDEQAIFADAKRYGSLKDSVLAHGIDDIDYLFPDDKALTKAPEFIKRPIEWVSKVMGGVKHTPFANVKTLFADITEADARAKGYVKGNQKIEEVFGLLKRRTGPCTIYKKQKIDRDDVIDITDFDVVAWLKTEMRMMLDEEIARAILIGDGRSAASEDKINEQNIRPIWTDADLFTIKKSITVAATATDEQKAKAFIKAAIKARKDYEGSGNPVLFTTEDVLTDCLLIEDTTGRVIYETEEKLRTALRVKEIITVPVMEGKSRISGSTTYNLMGIIVNLADYNIGADKGGAVSMFDDFDIDYNAQKYLIETRCSGALIKPHSAIALELVYSTALTVSAEDATETILGKTVSDLQSGIIVNDDFIKGTLKYVTGYTGYSGKTEEQSGNYLALKVDAPSGATVTCENLTTGRVVTFDSDMNIVIRVADASTKYKFTSTLNGFEVSKTFSVKGLKLENA